MRYHLLIVQLMFCLSIGWPAQEAHAYLDPGTGSLLLQSLFAAIAVIGAAISLFWGRVRGFFRKGRLTDVATESNVDERDDA
jgi:hypothetical protein